MMLFISYSSQEKELADSVRKMLQEHGVECWMAPESIRPGSNYANDIPVAIHNCDAFLVILSKQSQESVWVPKELDMAFTMRKKIIPLHTDQSEITLSFKFYLSNVQQIEASKCLERVIDHLSDYLLGKMYTVSSADIPSSLPEKISLFQLLNVRNTKELDIEQIRARNDVTRSLSVPIGIDEQGESVYLDIHHKGDGHNGLCFGPSRSGKTEFIITFMLSLALHFSQDDIRFYLVDFRHDASQTLNALPHLSGSLTELYNEKAASEFITAITTEIDNRKKLLQDNGVSNIYQYLKKRKITGYTLPPMPHILITVDDLNKLKPVMPQIAYEITTLGTPLFSEKYGFHLLFCTDCPAGVVDDRLFQTLNYQVCSNMYQNIEAADNLHSDKSCPGRLFFASSALDAPHLIQVAYSGEKADIPINSNMDMIEMGWPHFAKKQSEAIIGLIKRYELD